MKKRKFLLAALSIIMIITCIAALSACSDDGDATTKISSVELKDDTVTVKATLEASYAENHSGDRLYLLAVSSTDADGSLELAEVVSDSKAKSKMTFKFPLVSDSGMSRIACAFVLAEKATDGYSPITSFAYISNPESSAYSEKTANSASGIKGYLTEDIYASKLLGAEHILLEAEMNKLILEDHVKDAVRFNYDGISYYYNTSEVERLDKLAEDANNAGMRTYIRTVLRKSEDDSLSFLYCKKAKDDALGYLPDLSDEKSVRYIKAFYAFLASRYDVSDFIIGERVNDFATYCNAGRLTSDEFETMYSFWARLSHQMLRSVNSVARIYIPVDNAWRVDTSASRVGAKVFLSRFADKARAEGDFDYSIALSLTEGSDLSSLISGQDHEYSHIGVATLSDLTKFLENTEMRYKSEKRSAIIDSLSLSADIKEKDRAAYYTCAYYTAIEHGFDAFFYSSFPYNAAGERADLYYAMLMCGSSLNSQLDDYTSSIDDITIPDFDSHISNNLTYEQSAELDIDDAIQKKKKPLSLPLNSMTAGGGVYNIQGKYNEGEDEPYISWIVDADLSKCGGAVSAFGIDASDITGSQYIGVTMSSDNDALAAVVISVGNNTFIGETSVSDIEKTYYFDISKFAKDGKSAEELSISVCLLSSDEDEVSLEIRELSLYGTSSADSEKIIIIVVVAVIILALVGVIVLLVVKRKKKSTAKQNSED